jgi:hypothetical protein
MTVFWDVVPCSLVKVDRRFRGAYCLHHEGDEGRENLKSQICTFCPKEFSISWILNDVILYQYQQPYVKWQAWMVKKLSLQIFKRGS